MLTCTITIGAEQALEDSGTIVKETKNITHSNSDKKNDTAEPSSDEVERIFVTAGKRMQGLQQTPIALTVVNSEAIQQAKIQDINDLQTLVPTLRVTTLSRSANTNFSIRGFGNGINDTGIEPSVGIFVDGVYRSRAAAQLGDLPRLQQIEVLSGPQSTLFGKNSSAGVINVRTEEPTYYNQGRIEASIGNYNQRLLKGYYTNGITDDLAYSLSGGMNIRDGYTKSITGFDALNNHDRWNVRGQMLYEPRENVKIRLISDYSEIEELCCTVSDTIQGATTQAIIALGATVIDTTTPFAYESALNFNPVNTIEDGGVSLQADIDFDGFSFTSITGFRNNISNYVSDIDYSGLDIIREEGHTDIDTLTQEFRLTSTATNSLDWMVGAFFFDEDLSTGDTLFFGESIRSYFDILGLAPLLAGAEIAYGLDSGAFFAEGPALNNEITQQNQASSIFVSLDYHFTDALTTTLGLSYTNDEKEVTITTMNSDVLSAIDLDSAPTVFGVLLADLGMISPDFSPLADNIDVIKSVQFVTPRINYPNAVEDGKSSDDKTTWSIRIAYELNSNINFFATAATGYKATSWSFSRDSAPFLTDASALEAAGLVQPNQVYGARRASPESAKVFELGIKASFEQYAFNVTAFDQAIKDFQSSSFTGTGFLLANAGKQSTKGIEFDSTFNLIDNIVLTLSGTILDPIYDSFINGSGLADDQVTAITQDLSGEIPSNISKRSFSAGITYNFELDNDMYGYLRSDYLYESEARLEYNVPASLTHKTNAFNASAGLYLKNGINLQLYVRNLTNDKSYLSAFPTPIQAGSFTTYPSQPRTFGATISYEFD